MRKMNSVSENAKRFVGKEFTTINYGKCVVVDYRGCTEVVVKFYNPVGYATCQVGSLIRGRVANPNFPSVYGRGYKGIGSYNGKDDKKAYKLWETMLKRAYCPKYIKGNPAYLNVDVCDEWLNFQNFAKWCYEQGCFGLKDASGNVYQLDKDILVKGNKIYSPETCCFVPQEINLLLVNKKRDRGLYPIGVSKNKNKYMVNLTKGRNRIYLGRYKTPEEAFLVYKEAKESHIKEVTAMWKSRISDQTYQALMKWEVNIDD